ncbi:MAG: DNA (cytosine-5-)-methyltransferase [Candidatus Pelagibacter sp. TMED196]|nr:MAG: DNA (cytosine-5-)-methyltransferase [Candidatus Pelagibacter sp. TMED196]
MKNTFIDLFAGCGGLSLGLEQAGFHPVYVNELNIDALNTYLINRPEYKYLKLNEFHSQDITELTGSKKNLLKLSNNLKNRFNINNGEISLIVGGPPCQGYSGIGHRRNYKVDKKEIPSNYLYKEMIKVINHFNPKGYIFENVRGLLSARWSKNGKKGEIFQDILKQFKTLKNYNFVHSLIQSKNYGVPQNRPRVLLVGIRKDINFNVTKDNIFPKQDSTYPDLGELLSDLIDNNYDKNYVSNKYLSFPKTNIQKLLRTKKDGKTILKKGDKLTEQEYSKHSDKVIRKFKYMINNNGKIPQKFKTKKFAQRLLPKKWNGQGPNITATSLPDDYVHFSQPRCLTVREWARLQMFPDWYIFKGKRHTGGLRRAGNPQKGIFDREVPKYTQIGNAVPVELAKRLGLSLKKKLS